MGVEVGLALAASLVASLVLPRVGRQLAPANEAATLLLGGLLAGVVWIGGTALLAASIVGRMRVAGSLGHWSVTVFAARQPVPPFAGVLGMAVLMSAALVLALALRRLASELVRLYRLRTGTRALQNGDVVIVDADNPQAVTLPGWPGSIVLTTGLLNALTAAERRVLLAHERSHLRNHHWLFKILVRLAAALLPTLRPAVHQCDQALERWADEDAAAEVGNRRLVAVAVAKAALADVSRDESALAAGFSDGSVAARVEAMLEEPVPNRWGWLALPGGALLPAVVAVLIAAYKLEDVFELARQL